MVHELNRQVGEWLFRVRGWTIGLLFFAGAIFVLRVGELASPWLTGHAGELNTVAAFVAVLFWVWI
jgi:predicted PurR-regulated permease PerM